MLVMLGFGSSARKGATGWTDRARIRSVIDLVQPDVTVDGASPAGGADHVFFAEACEHFTARGLDVDRTRCCPMDRALDGPGGRAFLRRNERMYREHRPSLAVGFVSGKVGSPLSAGSAAMARICLTGRRGTDARIVLAQPCALVVYREDGVEPYADLATAYHQMRRLYVATLDERLVAPGQALKALATMNAASREEVLAALGYARDGSRWAPWIEAVEATVKVC